MAALAIVHMVYRRILLQAVLVKLQDHRETVSVISSQVLYLLLPHICTILNLDAVLHRWDLWAPKILQILHL